MNFIEYKDTLNSKDIKLFDYDYRISYNNLLMLNGNIINNGNMTGGSINNYVVSPFVVIKRADKNKLSKFVSNLVNNNFNGAKYLCTIESKKNI